MYLRILAALAAGLACAAPAPAQKPDPPAKLQPNAAPSEALLKAVHAESVAPDDAENVNDIPLFEMLQKLSKRHGVTFVIMEEQFRAAGVNDIKERKSNFALAKAKGMTLHRFLTIVLASMDARYLVRGDYLEIVPLAPAAAKPDEVVVSLVVKEKPFNEVVEKLAEQYDLSVVIAPQSGDARTGFVTARLKNQPPEIALELLAVQCDLRVVRKGTAFLITSRDHANEMFNEKLEKERQKIEVEKLRHAPPPKPEPEPKP
jgi:hypothetical protein